MEAQDRPARVLAVLVSAIKPYVEFEPQACRVPVGGNLLPSG